MEKQQAFELFKLKHNSQIDWLNLHQKTSQQYFTLISALFAASLTVFFNNLDQPTSDITFFGFALNALLGMAGIKLCHRYYQRFLEDITISAKIEPLIGLNDERPAMPGNAIKPFHKDKHYLLERYFKSRTECDTAEEFIKMQIKAGANKYVRWSFMFLIIVNLAFCLVIIVRFISKSRWTVLSGN